MTDVRPFAPMPGDLALVSRLAKSQFLMDNATAFARGVNPLESALLSTVPLADMGLPTLILREDDHGYLGQIRHRAGERHAQLVCLAPVPGELEDDETQWLHLIDGLVRVAGKRGAHILKAEVPEYEYEVIKLLRKAGFWVYSRQTIYRHKPGHFVEAPETDRLCLRWATDRDKNRILALQGNLVPSIVQQAMSPYDDEDFRALVVETLQEGRLVGSLEVVDGKCGLLVKPLLHPDIFEAEAQWTFTMALRSLPKADKLPVYFSIPNFQEWLRVPLQSLELTEIDRQVVLVKHMSIKNRQSDEIVQAAREVIFGTSLVSAIELGVDRDTTP
jgi:hypothetical protein